MPNANHKPRDFDVWASAVRQQMLESLARRRGSSQSDSGSSTSRRDRFSELDK